ncbi:MAG: PD40 domain-containing protein [Bacteroidetes bacterium]|nr:PD40 domain-containing protein [Bacteroidota bacterium]
MKFVKIFLIVVLTIGLVLLLDIVRPAEWSEPVQITQGIDVFSVQFTSDGTLLFTANNSVFLADADGSNQRVIFTGSDLKRATMSPDGKRLVFDNDFDIFMVNADGTEPIANDPEVFEFGSSFSSDGKELTFVTIDDVNQEYGIWVMDLGDGSKKNVLASDNIILRHARWSPDRTKLSYFWIAKNGTSIISVLEGGDRQDLTSPDVYSRQASWRPDGKQLAYSAMREGEDFDLWIMEADGSNKRQITSLVGDETKASWSPDGRKIAFVCSDCQNSEGSDIYMVTR